MTQDFQAEAICGISQYQHLALCFSTMTLETPWKGPGDAGNPGGFLALQALHPLIRMVLPGLDCSL